MFCGNEAGQLIVVHLPSRTVVVRSDVHPGPVTALDVLYLDPPPLTTSSSATSMSPEASSKAAAESAEPGEGSAAVGSTAADGAVVSPSHSTSTPAVILASASRKMVCAYSVNFEKSMLSLLCMGDTPVEAGGSGSVNNLEFSPDGRSLVLTAGDGALAVYGLPELPAEEWPGYVQHKMEGGDGETTAAVGEGDGSTRAPPGDSDTTMKPLVWLPASAAAAVFGLKTTPATKVSSTFTDPTSEEEGAPARAEDDDNEETPVVAFQTSADATAASQGAPTTHFRLVRLPSGAVAFGQEESAPRYRADAVFVRWPACNRLAMFQFNGATNVPAGFNRVPNLRGGARTSAGNDDSADDTAGAGDDATPSTELTPSPGGAVAVTSPACDWTMPFPVSASAATNDGKLLALGMTDGSVVLFNMRLAAVARVLDRLGNVNSAGKEVTSPLACSALSFWNSGDLSSDTKQVTLAAVTAAGWLALFDLDDDEGDTNPKVLTPRGAAHVPRSLMAQREGIFGLMMGKETTSSSDGPGGLAASTEEGSDWFIRMLDLSGFTDFVSVLSPPEGCNFAQGPDGLLIGDFRGGGTVVMGVNEKYMPVAETVAATPTKLDGPITDENEGEADGTAKEHDTAADSPAGEECGEETGTMAAPLPPPSPSMSAVKLCVYNIPPGHRGNVRMGQLAGATIPEPAPMMQRMLEEQPSVTAVPSGHSNTLATVRSGGKQKNLSIAVPGSQAGGGLALGATSPTRSRYGGKIVGGAMSSRHTLSPSQRSLLSQGLISPRQEGSFTSAYSQQTDLSAHVALDPVDPVAACLARLLHQGGGRNARKRRIARRHREIEAELEQQAALDRASPPLATVR